MSTTMRIRAKSPTKTTHKVTAFAFTEATPPGEIQLWNVGENPTDYGVHVWNDRSIAEIMSEYELRGNPLLIDVEHNEGETPDGEPGLTGGYASLEIRSGAPWLVFDWSKYGAEQIASKQRRFLSPDYLVDSATNEIVGLCRVSLVASPGTHRARMLASARITTKENRQMDINMLLAALKAALTAEDPKAAIQSLLDEVAKLDGGDAAATTDVDPPAADVMTEEKKDLPPGVNPDAQVAAAAATAQKKDRNVVEGVKPTVSVVATADEAKGDKALRIAAAAAKTSEDTMRDFLLEKYGDRIPEESLRVWASSQPLAVVKGFLDSLPAKIAVAKVSATRGSTQGIADQGEGLQGEELEEIRAGLGRSRVAASSKPYRIEGKAGVFFPNLTPSEIRAAKAKEASK